MPMSDANDDIYMIVYNFSGEKNIQTFYICIVNDQS